jgi:uncharacterized protein YdeI (BOF family)
VRRVLPYFIFFVKPFSLARRLLFFTGRSAHTSPGGFDFMKKLQSFWILAALVMSLGVGTSLMAQEPSQPTQTPSTPTDQPSQTQPPAQAQPPADQTAPTSDPQSQPQAQPGQTPDTSGQTSDSKATSQGATQTFTGMINKQGEQYVLQDASGTVYNIDNQAAAKKYEGKKVNIHGTLDPDGKTIHVQ